MTLVLNGSVGVSDVDGSAATPAIRGTDANTGMFFPAADTIAFAEGGAEVMRIDSAGNVGIGTSSPSSPFQVHRDSVSFVNLKVSNSVTGSGSLDGVDLVCGTSGEAYLYNRENQPLIFGTNNTERARIDASGNFWFRSTGSTQPWDATSGTFTKIGDTTYPLGITCQGNICAIINRNTSTGTAIEFKYNATPVGSISVTGSATGFNTSSDYRLKDNIVPINKGLLTVGALKPVSYKWKADGSDGEGFIAHELQEIIPQSVYGEKDAVNEDGSIKPQAVDYSKIVVHLVAAIQELKAENDALKARVEALENV